MQAGKVLGYVVGGIVALVATALLCIGLIVDPNRYKSRIDAAVKNATGRDLSLQGDLKLSVFPWVALRMGPASLGNPPGFGAQPFVSFKHAEFRVKLLPLLGKRLEIGRVELDGLDARLIKNADGKANWQGFGQQTAQSPATAEGNSGSEVFAGIAGIKITNARVSYNQFVLENLNVETGAFATKALMPVSIHFDASRGVAAERAAVDATFDFSGDLGAKRYGLAAIMLHAKLTRALDPRPLLCNLSSPSLALDLEAQSLAVPSFVLDLAGAQVTGSMAGSHLIDAPELSGKVALLPLGVREFLGRLGMAAPRTRDPKALSSVSASTAFAFRSNGMAFDDLSVLVDDTELKGTAAVLDLTTRAIRFALAVDHIDIDRYLAPQGEAAAPAAAKAAPPRNAPASTPIDANGTLTVGSIHVTPLDLTEVSVTLTASGGLIHVFPLQARVDGGQYSGNLTLDARESVPMLTMDEHLTGIEVGKLVSTGTKALHASGHGNVSLKASARGAAADALLESLNGHFDAYVNQGALEGVDIGFQLGRAEAVIRRKDIPTTPDTRRTPFDTMKMSAEIINGVVQSKDLSIVSPFLKVTGQGSANLPTKTLDFSLLADTLRTAGNTPIQVPIKVTGSLSDPTLRPDLEALAKGQLRQKVQDVVQEKLKGLFNR